ncbi:site-2 protease family protein [Dongia deserti]|uniref:site-2 protease family protein n=1 Tax=Dongia deserti TaxID=2268030 RepID=UPI000E64C993|nr:site-2 protease family protein [Dongia deserti]
MSPEITLLLLKVIIYAPGIILAITLHEASHGYVAWKLGDDTAYMLGRVTFNPLRHIDPLGTIILPALLVATTGFMFGYAKPVPVNFRKLRDPKRDMVLVAAAGPASNIVIALASAIALRLMPGTATMTTAVIAEIFMYSIFFNVIIAIFNMIPLPPLDGGRVAVGLLPYPLSWYLARLERYGMVILLGALIGLPLIGQQMGTDLNIFRWFIMPIVDYVQGLIYLVTGNTAP